MSTPGPNPYGAMGAPFRWQPSPTVTDPDAIRILDGWAQLNITSFACEELARWTKGHSRIVTLDYRAREKFLAVWAAWEKAGVLDAIPYQYKRDGKLVGDGWAGGWCARYKRGVPHDDNVHHLSNHARGTAFDIAAQRYPLSAKPAATDPIHALVPIAKANGWRWGGDFSRCDAMHWELA